MTGRRVVDAITERARREAERKLRPSLPFKAVVTAVKDGGKDIRTADMLLSDIELEDDDLTLGQWARRYGARFGFEVGDVIVVQPTDDDDYVVVEVVSETDVEDPAP